jgi:hypothetical protein
MRSSIQIFIDVQSLRAREEIRGQEVRRRVPRLCEDPPFWERTSGRAKCAFARSESDAKQCRAAMTSRQRVPGNAPTAATSRQYLVFSLNMSKEPFHGFPVRRTTRFDPETQTTVNHDGQLAFVL